MAETFAGYQIEGLVGSGGMGEVLRARRGPNSPLVALKVLPAWADPKAFSRLLREGEILIRLKHPNVVAVHEIGISDGRPFVAMELLSGHSLEKLLEKRKPVASEIARQVARAIASGLAAAHDEGVLHRDIKPANVVLTLEGRVVLIDFGIALDTDAASRLTQSGATVGSPAYYSPEQSKGKTVDRRSDIYQFGLLLHEMVVGQRPYPEMEPFPALMRRIKEGVPPVRSVFARADPTLANLIDACLDTDPSGRPASFRDVLAQLDPEESPRTTKDDALSRCPVPRAGDIPKQLGPWHIVCALGNGAMGMVFLVRKENDPVECALKLIFPHLLGRSTIVERFRREIRIAQKLSHPCLVRFVDEGVEGSTLYYVMEYVQGETILDRIRDQGKLEVKEAVSILEDMASGLNAMHQAGLVHRDLKPANVMIDRSGTAKLMDLGMAKDLSSTGLTKTNQIVGTPAYLPPEYELRGSYDSRGDLYQLGLLFHEMVTGRRDIPAYTDVWTMEDLCRKPPLSAPQELAYDAYAPLAKIHERLLAPDPSQRFQTTGELLDRLRESRQKQSPPIPKAARTPTKMTPSRESPRIPDREPKTAPAVRPEAAEPRPSSAAPTLRVHPKPLSDSSPNMGWVRTIIGQTMTVIIVIVKYSLVAIALIISIAVIWAIPSLIHRLGAQ